jgi:hypothetical protein
MGTIASRDSPFVSRSGGRHPDWLNIVDLPLEDLRLCVLSACETGLGDLTEAERVLGFATRFPRGGMSQRGQLALEGGRRDHGRLDDAVLLTIPSRNRRRRVAADREQILNALSRVVAEHLAQSPILREALSLAHPTAQPRAWCHCRVGHSLRLTHSTAHVSRLR